MLSLSDLLQFAEIKKMPTEKRRGIVREYLQTLILFYLQQSKYGEKLIFIGGTALRFFYDLQRFSEDLDFNYRGVLNKIDLENLLIELQTNLEKENIKFKFSIHKSTETYFHWKIYLQFSEILQAYGCSGKSGARLHRKEQLSIQLDFQNLGKQKLYPVNSRIIAGFGKRFLLNTTSLEMFLAEKSNAILYRKDAKGRDFFDFMSLILLGAKINLEYLKMREIQAKSIEEYRQIINKRVLSFDFKKLTGQLAPFLFNQEDVRIMESFPEHIKELLEKLSSAS